MQDPGTYFLHHYHLEARKKHVQRRIVQSLLSSSILLCILGILFRIAPPFTLLLFESALLICLAMFILSSNRKAKEREETLFMMLELDPELLEHSNRMQVAFQAVEAGKLESIQVSKTQRRNRGSDAKGFTSGRIESRLDSAQDRRDAIHSGSRYEGLEDDLRPSEILVNEANLRYQERADQLWKESESKDSDLIEAGVERLGDLVRTDWFEKNAKQGAVQELMDSNNQDEEI